MTHVIKTFSKNSWKVEEIGDTWKKLGHNREKEEKLGQKGAKNRKAKIKKVLTHC